MSERELKYKVGDEVWVKMMIKDVDLDDDVYPYLVWVTETVLSGCSNTEPPTKQSSFNDVEVGDIVLTTNGLKLFADYIGKDYVHSNEYGETFYFHEIAGIYKQTWKKEKTLEEMSREELIARIKQLEQGE